MPSFKSRLVVMAIRGRRLFLPKSQRFDRVENSTSVQALRDLVESTAGAMGKLPEGFTLEQDKVGDMDVEWMLPPAASKDRAILYLHGGGLVVGSVPAHRGVVAKFVEGTGIPALVIEYGLAPENPYPIALTQTLDAYQYLQDQGIPPHRIAFMGDSGGGNLCIASLLAIRDQGKPLPGAAVALSPWLDLTNSGESRTANLNKDALSWKNSDVVFSDYYCNGHDPKHPWISPIFGDLSGLPPTRIYAGSDELLVSDSITFADKARAAGSDVELTLGEGLFHCYPACAPLFPEATQAKNEICRFIVDRTAATN